MSPNETQLLQTFLTQLVQTQAGNKDSQAQIMIAEASARQPDAAYLLVQRCLLLEQAVAKAQTQIAQLQADNAELKSAQTNSSSQFLQASSSTWGNSVHSAPIGNLPVAGTSTSATSVTGAPLPSAAIATPTTYTSPTLTTPSTGFFGGNGGNMLGTVAATAAGVAAGAFLFNGIENLMGNHQSHAGHDANNMAGNLNNADGGLIPNYFSSDKATAAATPDSSATDTNLADASGIDDISSLDDSADSGIFDDI